MAPPSFSGQMRSAGQSLHAPIRPSDDDCVWRLPGGLILPPRRELARFGVLDESGDLKCKPFIVRGDNGPLIVIVSDLSCYFHSKGKKASGAITGRWLLTWFSTDKPSQWLIDECGDAYDIGSLTDGEKLARLSA